VKKKGEGRNGEEVVRENQREERKNEKEKREKGRRSRLGQVKPWERKGKKNKKEERKGRGERKRKRRIKKSLKIFEKKQGACAGDMNRSSFFKKKIKKKYKKIDFLKLLKLFFFKWVHIFISKKDFKKKK
jgi:phosphatidate phosphatase PAH1